MFCIRYSTNLVCGTGWNWRTVFPNVRSDVPESSTNAELNLSPIRLSMSALCSMNREQRPHLEWNFETFLMILSFLCGKLGGGNQPTQPKPTGPWPMFSPISLTLFFKVWWTLPQPFVVPTALG